MCGIVCQSHVSIAMEQVSSVPKKKSVSCFLVLLPLLPFFRCVALSQYANDPKYIYLQGCFSEHFLIAQHAFVISETNTGECIHHQPILIYLKHIGTILCVPVLNTSQHPYN